ncbi:hypothetical protein BDY19DRAFT_165311 [Irpex rosettiformis]|uniref:Uncharacterized protein n=1 Tax=Irpex rosettiformis TaxID=378272 RepID=A0ACB8U279_9APHY|nr:hypothetical protein BDY19DRAFT_165311 [Irpex rosettiformis]
MHSNHIPSHRRNMSVSGPHTHVDTRLQELLTLMEADNFSETTTLASFETSSTITVVHTDAQGSRIDMPLKTPPPKQAELEKKSWKQSFLAGIGLLSQKLSDDVIVLYLLRTVSTTDEPETRQYALEDLFVFIQDGRLHLVVQALSHFPKLVFHQLLQHLASYVPTPPDSSDQECDEHTSTASTTRALVQTTQLDRKFFVELISFHWERLMLEDVEEICTTLKEKSTLLKFLFPDHTQNVGDPPKHIHQIFTYFASPGTSCPPFVGDLFDIVPNRPTIAILNLSQRVLEATRPGANFYPTPTAPTEPEYVIYEPQFNKTASRTDVRLLHRHPAAPFLSLALCLARSNAYASAVLVAGGIVNNVRDLYDLDFPDPRLSDDVSLSKRYYKLDLVKLCHALLRALFPARDDKAKSHEYVRPPQGSFDPGSSTTTPNGLRLADPVLSSRDWFRAKELAESLMEFFSQDLRFHERAMCARYHDEEVLWRDEMEAEKRDQEFLRGIGGQRSVDDVGSFGTQVRSRGLCY